MSTIVDLDEETDVRLQDVLAFFTGQPETKISLGVWLARCTITWEAYQLLASYLGCITEVKKNPEYHKELLEEMIVHCQKKFPIQDALFLWKAQQAYRVVIAYYSAEEQQIIYSRIKGQKISMSRD